MLTRKNISWEPYHLIPEMVRLQPDTFGMAGLINVLLYSKDVQAGCEVICESASSIKFDDGVQKGAVKIW